MTAGPAASSAASPAIDVLPAVPGVSGHKNALAATTTAATTTAATTTAATTNGSQHADESFASSLAEATRSVGAPEREHGGSRDQMAKVAPGDQPAPSLLARRPAARTAPQAVNGRHPPGAVSDKPAPIVAVLGGTPAGAVATAVAEVPGAVHKCSTNLVVSTVPGAKAGAPEMPASSGASVRGANAQGAPPADSHALHSGGLGSQQMWSAELGDGVQQISSWHEAVSAKGTVLPAEQQMLPSKVRYAGPQASQAAQAAQAAQAEPRPAEHQVQTVGSAEAEQVSDGTKPATSAADLAVPNDRQVGAPRQRQDQDQQIDQQIIAQNPSPAHGTPRRSDAAVISAREGEGHGLPAPEQSISNSAGPNSAGPKGAGPNSAGPNSAGPNSAGPNSAGVASAGQAVPVGHPVVAPAPPNVPVAPERLAEPVLQVLQPALQRTDGSWQTTVHLDPPELGSVIATVTVHGAVVSVLLTYQSDATHRALQAVLHTVQSDLGDKATVTLADGRSGSSQQGSGQWAASHEQPVRPDDHLNRQSTGASSLMANPAPPTQHSQVDVLA